MKKMEIVTESVRLEVTDANAQAKIWAIVLGGSSTTARPEKEEQPEKKRMNKRPRRMPDNYGKKWSAEDDKELVRLRFEENRTFRFIAKQMNRTFYSIAARVDALKRSRDAAKNLSTI